MALVGTTTLPELDMDLGSPNNMEDGAAGRKLPAVDDTLAELNPLEDSNEDIAPVVGAPESFIPRPPPLPGGGRRVGNRTCPICLEALPWELVNVRMYKYILNVNCNHTVHAKCLLRQSEHAVANGRHLIRCAQEGCKEVWTHGGRYERLVYFLGERAAGLDQALAMNLPRPSDDDFAEARALCEGALAGVDCGVCPGCGIVIERLEGCDDMRCEYCEVSFCFNCGGGGCRCNPDEYDYNESYEGESSLMQLRAEAHARRWDNIPGPSTSFFDEIDDEDVQNHGDIEE